MKYVTITAERASDVIVHLRNTFFEDEPLNRSLQIADAGVGHAELEKHCAYTMAEGLSVMALSDDDKVCDARVDRTTADPTNTDAVIPRSLASA